MKFLRIFLVFHIIFSLLLIFMILFGGQVFDALGLDIPWDEMVSEANDRVRDAVMTVGKHLHIVIVRVASCTANALQNTAEVLSSWVSTQQA